jgi:bacillithiol biosynthesis cysteine-adding enzyme BshC
MGSEDADLDELGHIYIAGQKYTWETKQTGAVGRMKVDKALIQLIEMISGQLTVHPFGTAITGLLKDAYVEGKTIEQATFKLVNELFAEYGLLILLPDNAELKRAFIPVVEKELTEQFSHKAVTATAALFPKEYKVQASGREVNLFYLENDLRERIVNEHSTFNIQHTSLKFDTPAIKEELLQHPEKFSTNVILRPVFQEMILPDIVFIGGGGEIAYWLELQKVFEQVNVPFPVLQLRNSFMVVEKKYGLKAQKLGFTINDLFSTEQDLLRELVKRETTVQLKLDKEKEALQAFYERLKATAGAVDITLQQHTAALGKQALNKVDALEKKMLRAEKKKFEAQQRQIQKLKAALFPADSLQERIENILPYYAKWGNDFIKMLYENSLGLEQHFVILEEV